MEGGGTVVELWLSRLLGELKAEKKFVREICQAWKENSFGKEEVEAGH